MVDKQMVGIYEGDKVPRYYKRAKGGKEEATGGIDVEVFEYLEKILPKSLKGKDALEIGCGDARWSNNLHERKARRIIGLDSSNDMIKLARRKKQTERLYRLSIYKGDMRNLYFPDESFDLVLSSFSIMYFPEIELNQIVRGVARVLRFGGNFYIATNVIYFRGGNSDLFEKIKNEIIPVNLGLGDRVVPTENAVQTVGQFKAAFKQAHLNLNVEEYFPPVGLSVPTDYMYHNYFTLGKAVFKLIKC